MKRACDVVVQKCRDKNSSVWCSASKRDAHANTGNEFIILLSKVGDFCQYKSTTYKKWIDARVTKVQGVGKGKQVELDVKAGRGFAFVFFLLSRVITGACFLLGRLSSSIRSRCCRD